MKRFFLITSAAFAAIPGISVIVSGLGTPPGSGYRLLFGGVIEALGSLALAVLWVNQKKIQRRAKRRITRTAIAMGLLSFVFIAGYVLLFRHTVIEHPRGTAYYPIWLSGNIKKRVEKAGSRDAAIEMYGIGAIRREIDEMGNGPLAITSILLLFLYQAIFTSLTIAFGLVGFHMRQSLEDKEVNALPPDGS